MSKKPSRKRRDQKEDSIPKQDLKSILREKIKEKQLGRLAPSARDNKIEKLKEKLSSVKEDNEEHRQKLQAHIELLKKVNENQIDSFTGEYPDYVDNVSYGGSIERGD
jgi:hypothetical protein